MVKYSTSFATGYNIYGSNLPNESLAYSPTPVSYFVIKAPNIITTIQTCYLGYYDGGGATPCDVNDAGYNSTTGNGNVSALPNASSNGWFRIQAITTGVKQW